MIAEVDRSDGLGGGQGIGVQQRDNNRHVLLADHQPSANRNLPENWSADSERVFWNTIDWVAQEPDPNDPLIVGWDFELDTEEVQVEVGTTDLAGSLTFETTAADAEYTVIVHRDGTGDEPGYLLQRPVPVHNSPPR